jgi:hypothetical protein
MAFSASEVRVLRRALTVALREGRDSVDFWLLGRAIGEAQDERERLRAFMTAELSRYRAALPGTASSFLSCLRTAVGEVGYVPSAEDLAALRTAADLPCGERERASRAALLRRCTRLAEIALEQRLTARARRRAAAKAARFTVPDPLDILIPGRTMPVSRRAVRPVEPTPARATPAAEPVPEIAPAALPAPGPTGPTGPTGAAGDELVAEPEPTNDEAAPAEFEAPAAEVSAAEVAEVGAPEPVDPGLETVAPDGAEPPAPDTSPTDAQPARTRPLDGQLPDVRLPDTQPCGQTAEQSGPERARETLSPVIPHRRQGRVLGQLPVPDILQTGTG